MDSGQNLGGGRSRWRVAMRLRTCSWVLLSAAWSALRCRRLFWGLDSYYCRGFCCGGESRRGRARKPPLIEIDYVTRSELQAGRW
ncbi:hypothetical protein GYMLUDRAFT_400575 [Collybiopsis luxurians FD-317 M1]|nr:hypothetical protein GYMLUDRAFT_400575 [Collybiopsis luxurians FD-317 M1]